MALPDYDLKINIRDRFSGFSSVARDLFPTAKYERVPINIYAESLRLQGRLTPAVQESVEKAGRIREETLAIGYIAGGLTEVDEVTKLRYAEVSDFLNSYGAMVCPDGKTKRKFFGYVPHLHGTDPVKHPNVSKDEVRDIDHLWAVVVADFGINFWSPMAHGNAIEKGWQEDHFIASVDQNRKGNKLSRLVLGMKNTFAIQEYPDMFNIEGSKELKLLMDEFSTWLETFPDRDPREFYYVSFDVLRTPLLKEHGLIPDKWNPLFRHADFLVYVKDPDHLRYGQVGEVEAYCWNQDGTYCIRFGKETDWSVKDTDKNRLSWWIR